MRSKDTFFGSRSEMDALVAQFKVLGVDKVVIYFEGSGDSGSIDNIWFYNANKTLIDIDDDTISWTMTTYGGQEPKAKVVSLYSAMEDLGYRVLDATGMDWYNNDGGQGEITLAVINNTIQVEVDMGINITQVESHEFIYGVDGLPDEDKFFPPTSEEK